MKSTIFWPSWGDVQEALRGAKWTKRNPGKFHLATRKCCKIQGFGESTVQNPCVFTCFFLLMFPNPYFLLAFSRKYAAPATIQRAPARPTRARTTAKTQGFRNLLAKTVVKTEGFASVECANTDFCGVFLSLTWCGYESRKNAHESIDFLQEFNESSKKRCKSDRENTGFWQNHVKT